LPEYPTEYTDAKANLIAFRQKVFNELVAGRVKALLDTNSETLGKFKALIDSLEINPYLVSNVSRKTLALVLNNLDIGYGKQVLATSRFNIDKAMYPLDSPYSVPPRLLPQVDVFKYTPPTDINLIEKANEQVWANLFIIQTASGVLLDVADAENVTNDYFKFRPIGRVKIEANLLSAVTGYETYTKLRGEATILARTVTIAETGETKDYDLFVFLDADYFSDTAKMGTVPLVILVTSNTSLNPEVILVCSGKRLSSLEQGLFAAWVENGQLIGLTKTHGAYNIVTEQILWSNKSKLTVQVNDADFGNTDPVVGVYDEDAVGSVTITGLPNSGYSIAGWELDGFQYPPSGSFTVKMYRDHIVTCVFGTGTIVTYRPCATGERDELRHYYEDAGWKCVDEAVSDGDASFVTNDTYNSQRSDLFMLPLLGLPSNAVIDWIKVYARMRHVGWNRTPRGNVMIKTNGQEVISNDVYPVKDTGYNLYMIEYDVNPVTHAPWTLYELQNLQIGVKLECLFGSFDPDPTFLRCTQEYVEVRYHLP
jgi:hypothetical protein